MTPTFTVIIPCYNQAHWLPEAVESALAQTPAPQVIVVDDGSTDATAEVAAWYGDRIRLIRQPNAGLPAARNAGILQADGEYLVFLDSDDALRPDYLARAATALTARPDVDVLHGRADVVDLDGNVIASFGGADLGPDPFARLLAGNDGPPNTWIVRRSLLARAGLFDPTLRSCEDWDQWLRCALAGGRFATDDSVVAVYRDVPGSMSKQVEQMWRAGVRVVRKHQAARHRAEDRATAARTLRAKARGYRAALARQARAGGWGAVAGVLARNPGLAWAILRGVGSR